MGSRRRLRDADGSRAPVFTYRRWRPGVFAVTVSSAPRLPVPAPAGSDEPTDGSVSEVGWFEPMAYPCRGVDEILGPGFDWSHAVERRPMRTGCGSPERQFGCVIEGAGRR